MCGNYSLNNLPVRKLNDNRRWLFSLSSAEIAAAAASATAASLPPNEFRTSQLRFKLSRFARIIASFSSWENASLVSSMVLAFTSCFNVPKKYLYAYAKCYSIAKSYEFCYFGLSKKPIATRQSSSVLVAFSFAFSAPSSRTPSK